MSKQHGTLSERESEASHQVERAQAPFDESVVCSLMHELAQPLTTVSAYVGGCIYRLSKGAKDQELILSAMRKAMQDIEYAQHIMLRMGEYLHQEETI